MKKTIRLMESFVKLFAKDNTSKSNSVVWTAQAERDNGKPAQILLQIRF